MTIRKITKKQLINLIKEEIRAIRAIQSEGFFSRLTGSTLSKQQKTAVMQFFNSLIQTYGKNDRGFSNEDRILNIANESSNLASFLTNLRKSIVFLDKENYPHLVQFFSRESGNPHSNDFADSVENDSEISQLATKAFNLLKTADQQRKDDITGQMQNQTAAGEAGYRAKLGQIDRNRAVRTSSLQQMRSPPLVRNGPSPSDPDQTIAGRTLAAQDRARVAAEERAQQLRASKRPGSLEERKNRTGR